MNQAAFEKLWQQVMDNRSQPREEEEELCIYAKHYGTWATTLYQDEVKAPTLVGINQKHLMLVKKYFEWRAAVPKNHRDRIGERGHVCIFHIFERNYQRLKALELALNPPMLFLPPPQLPAPKPVVQTIAGITLGEILGDEA